MRDKRLMTLSVVTALGLQDLLEVQVNAALQNDELTEDEMREMAIFLTHYVGFPLGSGFNGVIERVTAKRRKATAEGAANDTKANVNDAVKMHTGSGLD
jgi:4-carboxymuconolactone decarboxylase